MIRRNQLLTKILLACSTAILSFSVMAGPKQMDMRVDTRLVDREAQKAERKAYHQWLASERVAAAKANPLVVKAGTDELDAVDNAPKQTPEIVGFSQVLAIDVEFGQANITLQVRQTGQASERAMRETRFKIVGLGHIRPRFMAGECGFNADCVVNAACALTLSVH